MPERMLGDLQEKILEDILQKNVKNISIKISEDMSESILEDMSEDISKRDVRNMWNKNAGRYIRRYVKKGSQKIYQKKMSEIYPINKNIRKWVIKIY